MVLNRHNTLRSLHGVGALTWNQDLADYAQSYIDSLSGGSYDTCLSQTLIHSSRSGLDYGENLAYGTITAVEAVNLWYNELINYNFASPQNSNGTFEQYGHLTQLLWASSTEIGCVVESCDTWNPDRIYVICEYSREGNLFYASDDLDIRYLLFKENVPPPLSGKTYWAATVDIDDY